MKSFYQFYEQINESWVSTVSGQKLYVVSYIPKGSKMSDMRFDAYVNQADAHSVVKMITGSQISINDVTVRGVSYGRIYVVWGIKGGNSGIFDVYGNYAAANIFLKHLSWKAADHFYITKAIVHGHVSVKPSLPKTPQSPPPFKYPIIGELTHYLSTQGLNQEIYHVMRDKSQKSINLLNYLKTLINKIELV